jgi:hypothetical protein
MEMTTESKAIVSILIDIFSTSILNLCVRCMKGVHQIGSILQALSMINHLEQYQLLGLLDNSTWRALFIACSVIDEIDFSQRVIGLLFVCLRSLHTTIDPVAFVSYCQSFARSKRGNSHNECYLDPFFHLEQLGLTWIIRKTTVDTPSPDKITPTAPDKPTSSEPVSKTQVASSPTGSSLWGILRSKKKNIQEDLIKPIQPGVVKLPAKPYASLTSDLSKILQLSRGDTLFALKKPRHLPVASISTKMSSSMIDIQSFIYRDQTIAMRISELQKLYFKVRNQDNGNLKSIEVPPTPPKIGFKSLFLLL